MGICHALGITPGRLQPLNHWREETSGPMYEGTECPQYIIDHSTNDRYLNETPSSIRGKCLAAAILGLIPQTVALVSGTVLRIFRFLSLYAFWRADRPLDIKARCILWIVDGIRIAIFPLALPCFFLTGLYGLLTPLDGRKLYASMEILFQGHPLVAFCMHPQPLTPANYTDRWVQAMSCAIFIDIPVATAVMLIGQALRVVTFFAFWHHFFSRTRENHNLCTKGWHWLKDVLHIGTIIAKALLYLMGGLVAIVRTGMGAKSGVQLFFQLNSLYGTDTSNDNFIVPIYVRTHLFGGSETTQNAW